MTKGLMAMFAIYIALVCVLAVSIERVVEEVYESGGLQSVVEDIWYGNNETTK